MNTCLGSWLDPESRIGSPLKVFRYEWVLALALIKFLHFTFHNFFLFFVSGIRNTRPSRCILPCIRHHLPFHTFPVQTDVGWQVTWSLISVRVRNEYDSSWIHNHNLHRILGNTILLLQRVEVWRLDVWRRRWRDKIFGSYVFIFTSIHISKSYTNSKTTHFVEQYNHDVCNHFYTIKTQNVRLCYKNYHFLLNAV